MYCSVVAATISDMDGWPRDATGACMWHHCLITREEFEARADQSSSDGRRLLHSTANAASMFRMPAHRGGAPSCLLYCTTAAKRPAVHVPVKPSLVTQAAAVGEAVLFDVQVPERVV